MTVEELIIELSKYPKDLEIELVMEYDGGYTTNDIEIIKSKGIDTVEDIIFIRQRQ